MTVSLNRRVKIAALAAAATLALLLLALAAFPFGWCKGLIERRLSAATGETVTIARVERESAFSFTPVIRIDGLRVPQPRWAGAGDLASVRLLRVRVPVLPLLIGRVRPTLLAVSGARIALVRDAAGRESWRAKRRGGGGGGLDLGEVATLDAALDYRDAKQDRSLASHVTIDPARGLLLRGNALVAGHPASLLVRAPTPRAGARWPFVARLDGGGALTIVATGTMDAALTPQHTTVHVDARANDLRLIDRVIQAGLFGTQPVRLAVDARRDADVWTIRRLVGTIGRSDIAGHATIAKANGRSTIDATIASRGLDFDDLASDAGHAEARALERREGAKLVPNTRINLAKLARTDGRIAFHIDRLLGAGPSAPVAAEGVLTLDHQLLRVRPLTVRLTRGTLAGELKVDQRGGRAKPLVTIALDMTGASVSSLADVAQEGVEGRVTGRARLSGPGDTIREAVGHADGTVGLVADAGSLPAKLASMLGFDLGRELTTGSDSRTRLNCAVLGLKLRGGVGEVAPLIVDTDRAQSRGSGTITFPEEALAITVTGAPKRDSLLRLPGSVSLMGTIRDAKVIVPPRVKSFGNILKAIGRTITGNQGPTAPDANCAALKARALGG